MEMVTRDVGQDCDLRKQLRTALQLIARQLADGAPRRTGSERRQRWPIEHVAAQLGIDPLAAEDRVDEPAHRRLAVGARDCHERTTPQAPPQLGLVEHGGAAANRFADGRGAGIDARALHQAVPVRGLETRLLPGAKTGRTSRPRKLARDHLTARAHVNVPTEHRGTAGELGERSRSRRAGLAKSRHEIGARWHRRPAARFREGRWEDGDAHGINEKCEWAAISPSPPGRSSSVARPRRWKGGPLSRNPSELQGAATQTPPPT